MNQKTVTSQQALEQIDHHVSSESLESRISDYSPDFTLTDSLPSDSTGSGSNISLDSDGPSPAQRPCHSTVQILTWHKCDHSPTIQPFTGSPGVKATIDRNTSSLDIFYTYTDGYSYYQNQHVCRYSLFTGL